MKKNLILSLIIACLFTVIGQAQTKTISLDKVKLEKVLLNTKLTEFTYVAGSLSNSWIATFASKTNPLTDDLILSFRTVEDFNQFTIEEKTAKKYTRNGLEYIYFENEFIEVLCINFPNYKVSIELDLQIRYDGAITLENISDELNFPAILAAAV